MKHTGDIPGCEEEPPEIRLRFESLMAEMLRLPMYEQVRILTEQKHPKQTAQIFRIP